MPHPSNVPFREQALQMMRDVMIERGKQYEPDGNQEDNIHTIARMWTLRLSYKLKPGEEVTDDDMCDMMSLMKMARKMARGKLDHNLDEATYAAIGLATALAEENATQPVDKLCSHVWDFNISRNCKYCGKNYDELQEEIAK